MGAHSELGASVAKRNKACPASRKASRGMPNEPSEFAAQGSVAHALGEQGLLDWKEGKPWRSALAMKLGQVIEYDGFPIKVDRDMVRHVTGYVERTVALIEPGDELSVEVRLDLSSIHPGMFGTSDASVYQKRRKRLVVRDLKYGAGVGVVAEGNEQGLFYATGQFLTMKGGVEEVEIVIDQPRAPFGKPVKSWVVPASRLFDFMAELKEIAEATEVENPTFKPGAHCQFCPAAPLCPALFTLFNETMAEIEAFMTANQHSRVPKYDGDQMDALLRKLPIAEGFIKRFREFALREKQQGRGPSNHKLVTGRSTRQWKDPAGAKAMLLLLGLSEHEVMTEPELLSPAQAEELLPKESKKLLAAFMSKSVAGTSLAPAEDEREPVVVMTARQAFAGPPKK